MLKAMKRFLLATVFAVTVIVSVQDKANAEPVSLGSAIGLALFSAGVPVAGFTATTALIVGNIVIGAATIGAQLLLGQQSSPNPVDPGQFKQNYENPEGPEIRAVGRVRLGGLFFFRNTSGAYTYRLIAQCRGPIDAIEEYYVGGREIVVNQSNGVVESPPWANAGVGNEYLTVENKIGDGTETAWPDVITAFPQLWTSDHRARGIAQIKAVFRSPGINTETYLSLFGSPGVRDQIETVIRAELIYDPREASHDIDDNTTWEWSDNGILCAAHILRSFASIADSEIDWDDIETEADKADVLVATKDGTERRARASGSWQADGESRGKIMEAMLDSIGAEITESEAGLIRIRLVDDNRPSELTYTSKHITGIRLKYGLESVERPNVCRLWYYSPERDFDVAELPLVEDDGETPIGWSRYQDEIDRVGEQPFELRLPFCPSASQAQRIARRRFLLERADRGIANSNMAGVACWGMRVVDLPFPDIAPGGGDLSQKCLIGTPRVDDEAAEVEIPFIVQPTIAAWVPATDEADSLPDVPQIEFESDLDKPTSPSGVALVQYADNSYELRMLFTPVTGTSTAEANYRTFRDNDPNLPSVWISMQEIGDNFGWASVGDILGDRIDTRVRMVGASSDVLSYFSDVLRVSSLAIDNTAPPAPVINGTATTNGIEYDVDIDVTFPLDVSAIRLVITREIGTGGETTVVDQEGRNGDNHAISETIADTGDDLTYRATFYTSNDTASPTTTLTITSAAGP